MQPKNAHALNNSWKRQDTTQDLIVWFSGVMPNPAHAWTVRVADSKGYLGDYDATLQGNRFVIDTGQFADFPVGHYVLEIWETYSKDGKAETGIYPNPDSFVTFDINKNVVDDDLVKSFDLDEVLGKAAARANKAIVVDGTETLPAGSQATVESRYDGERVHFTFKLPKGADGKDGKDGNDGATPQIGSNGNWIIAGHDTGKPSVGRQEDLDNLINRVWGVTDALRGDEIEQLTLQNKVWQRRNSLNVVMDKWIDGQGVVQPYKGWCYTPYYVPVTPHTDYVFAARNAGATSVYNIMPMASVFVVLYDDAKRYLGSTQTTNHSRGSFNTGGASYIRFSMSARAIGDSQMPSLFIGKDLPDDITAEIGPRYPQTDAAILANATAKFGMVPSVTIAKMDSLPLYLYRDTLVTGDVAGETMVYLTNNQSGDITPNATDSGWAVPKKRLESGLLPFVATKGHSTSSYWVMPADNLQRQTTVYLKSLAETDGSGKTIRVLVIGDSLTNYNTYVNRAGELAGADTHTHITFLGTRGDVTKHEGRGGWAAKTYTTKAQFNTYSNPFLSDNKFNFDSYMAAQGYDGVDLVIINLGTNDVTYNDINSDPDFTTDFAAYTEMITSIKAYNPKVTIALGSTITPARYGNSHLETKTRRQEWNAQLQKYCQQNGYTYIPYALVVDPINDFKYNDVPIDEYNQTIVKKIADSTHPAESGYKKMGDLTYATIKMIAAGMQTTMQ